jgi:hypothetical protein
MNGTFGRARAPAFLGLAGDPVEPSSAANPCRALGGMLALRLLPDSLKMAGGKR